MNARLDALQAAVLLAKLPHFDAELARKTAAADCCSRGLSGACVPPVTAPGNTHVFAQYTVRVPDRDGVATRLREAGIPMAVYYPKCLYEERIFSGLGYGPGSFPVSEKASKEVLSLPMHPFLTREDQNRVICAFLDAAKRGAS